MGRLMRRLERAEYQLKPNPSALDGKSYQEWEAAWWTQQVERAWGEERDGAKTVPEPPIRPGSFMAAVAGASAELEADGADRGAP